MFLIPRENTALQLGLVVLTYNVFFSFAYTILSAVGKFPLGFGVFLLWPLVKKFGKRPVMIIGFSIAAAAELLCLLFSKSMPVITGIRRTSWACGW